MYINIKKPRHFTESLVLKYKSDGFPRAVGASKWCKCVTFIALNFYLHFDFILIFSFPK